MRIFDIEIYRDGGSLELSIEKNGIIRHVWLDTPLKGEPRALVVDSKALERGNPKVHELLSDIEEWWYQLPAATQLHIQEVREHKGAYYNPTPEMSEAIDLSRVLTVRDYVLDTYSA